MELNVTQKHLFKAAHCATKKIIKNVFLDLFGIITVIVLFNLTLNGIWNYSILNSSSWHLNLKQSYFQMLTLLYWRENKRDIENICIIISLLYIYPLSLYKTICQ